MGRAMVAYDCALILESYRAGSATSQCVAITKTSHYRAGIILRYYVYAQSRTGDLVTSFPLENKTNKDKMLRRTVLPFV